jgi:hypothetical protein
MMENLLAKTAYYKYNDGLRRMQLQDMAIPELAEMTVKFARVK